MGYIRDFILSLLRLQNAFFTMKSMQQRDKSNVVKALKIISYSLYRRAMENRSLDIQGKDDILRAKILKLSVQSIRQSQIKFLK